MEGELAWRKNWKEEGVTNKDLCVKSKLLCFFILIYFDISQNFKPSYRSLRSLHDAFLGQLSCKEKKWKKFSFPLLFKKIKGENACNIVKFAKYAKGVCLKISFLLPKQNWRIKSTKQFLWNIKTSAFFTPLTFCTPLMFRNFKVSDLSSLYRGSLF